MISYDNRGWSCGDCNKTGIWGEERCCERTKRIKHGRVEERDGAWFRPQVQNDWEILTYAPFLMFRTGTNVTVDPQVAIRAGQRFDVRWPDGSVTTETVQARSRRTSVCDMGHTYGVTAERLVVVTNVRGAVTEVDIRELWLRAPKEEVK